MPRKKKPGAAPSPAASQHVAHRASDTVANPTPAAPDPAAQAALATFVAKHGKLVHGRWQCGVNPDSTVGFEAHGARDGWHEHAGVRGLFRHGRLVEIVPA